MRVYQFRHAGIVGIPENGARLRTYLRPKVQAQSPKRLAKRPTDGLTCGTFSHIMPGPIYGVTFQTKQNHECTQVTQCHVARTRRQGR